MNRKGCLGEILTSIFIAGLVLLVSLGISAGIAKLLAADTPVETTDQVRVYSFVGWEPGTYHVTITIGNDGQIVSIGSLNIVEVPVPKLTPTKPTTPVNPEGPDDPAVPLAGEIKALAERAPSMNRQAMAESYQLIAELSTTTIEDLRETEALTFELLQKANPLSAAWKKWKDDFDELVSSVAGVDDLRSAYALMGKELD